MQNHVQQTRYRLAHFASPANLRGRIYRQRAQVTLTSYAAPDRISYADALQGQYQPVAVGHQFGPLWSTHWVRVDLAIPRDWAGQEVHFLWNSSSEALVWVDGQPVQGLSGTADDGRGPHHYHYRLTKSAEGGEQITLYIEVAVNGLFGVGPQPNPFTRIGLLRQAEIAVFDRALWDLLWDYTIIAEMAEHLPVNTPRGGQALYTANTMVNTIDLDDPGTWNEAHAIAAQFFSAKNGGGQHNISAIGHAHIDTAWLWPLAETKRKCIRTFSTVLQLMDDYPDYIFSWSQAQQYVWMKELQPELYKKLKQRIHEGRIVPVGGTWVEQDCNVPSGEAHVRQFLYGQRFFKQEFGAYCKEFWLPDTFGYPPVLPQIMRGAGIKFFLTQKLSWNQFNKPDHSTMIWEGQDGSQVLVHFPPADTYNAICTVKEVLYNASNFKDHERSRESFYLFGWGDGGGGPTAEMLERLARMKDVDGLPRIEQRTSQAFFQRMLDDIEDPVKWVGELYFELHRGTYTTQADNKRDNRRSEFLLHDVEFLAALAQVRATAAYPRAEIDRLWKLVLLNQFHDILPGSSITAVYADSDKDYAEVLRGGADLRDRAVNTLLPPSTGDGGMRLAVINTTSFPRREVAELPVVMSTLQASAEGNPLAVVSAPAYGYTLHSAELLSSDAGVEDPVSLLQDAQSFTLENGYVSATFGRDGRLISLYDKRLDRESIPPGQAANDFVIYDDDPVNWDAWDMDVYHLEKSFAVAPARAARVLESGPLRAMIEFEYDLSSKSSLRQRVSLTCVGPRVDFETWVDWHEKRSFLKVEFPLNVRTDFATYEMQFGHVRRPNHYNTSYDLARFEVPAHKWADLSEPDFGVAILNDSKYGYAALGNVLRLSLLRSPNWPDPKADQGEHHFRYAILPHAVNPQNGGVIGQGYAFNAPLIFQGTGAAEGAVHEHSFFSVDNPAVVLETVKQAEDSHALILRLYESEGGQNTVRLRSDLPVKSAALCNLLEEEDKQVQWSEGGVDLTLTAFQLVTLKLVL